MNMEMHPYFTEIPQVSISYLAPQGLLSQVLLALTVDPLEAEDVALTIRETSFTRIKLDIDNKVIDAPIALSDFQNLPSKHAFECLKITLSQWAMTIGRADDTLRVLAEWDRRFGVWCACAVARDALPYVRAGEKRPSLAIRTAESWVRGRANEKAVIRASKAARLAAASAPNFSAAEAAANAGAADAAANAADGAFIENASIVSYAADAAARAAVSSAGYLGGDAFYEAQSIELVRLREVVANACLTFPG